MGINSLNKFDCNTRSKTRARFISNLGFKFKIGVMIYERPGSLCKSVLVWKVAPTNTQKSSRFQACVVEGSWELPEILSNLQTKDAVDYIAHACCASKIKSKAVLEAIVPGSITPSFTRGMANKSTIISEAVEIIIASDSNADLDLLTNMRKLNSHGNKNGLGQLIWAFVQCSVHVLELENGTGAHHQRHAGPDEYTTVNVAFTPGVLSTSQLFDKTIDYFKKKNKEEGIHYSIPSKLHFDYLFSASKQFKVPFIKKLQSWDARDYSHPCGHYVAGLKRNWQYDTSLFHKLCLKNLLAHDNTILTRISHPVNGIWKVCVDDKTSVPVGWAVPISSVQNQSTKAPMPWDSSLCGRLWLVLQEVDSKCYSSHE